MAQFNWGKIEKLATEAAQVQMKSGAGKEAVDAAMIRKNSAPNMAADIFVQTIVNQIISSGLSPHAVAALTVIDHGEVEKNADGTYGVDIRFVGDMHRDSLDPKSYPDGISNLAALFNNGVDHEMKPVHGMWHGQDTWSRTVIPGAHFAEGAVRAFMSGAAQRYGVIDITINDMFK